jgi:hypothetical protein
VLLRSLIQHYLETNTYSVIEQAADADLGSAAERKRLHEWFCFIAREHDALSKDTEASESERQLRMQLAKDWDELALRWYGENDLISIRKKLWKLIDEEDRLRASVRQSFQVPEKGKASLVSRIFRDHDESTQNGRLK